MRLIVLTIAGLILSSVVAAKGLKYTPITRSALQKLLGSQAQAVLSSLNKGQIVITALHDAEIKREFDLYMLANEFSKDEHSIVEMLKAVVNGQEDNLGYIFVPATGKKIERYDYFYYTSNRREWVEIEGKKEKIDVRLTHADIKFLSDNYSLADVLRDNRFYMERYTHADQSSVRYLQELRSELNGKLSQELGDELHKHNLGEILIGNDYLATLEALVLESDVANQRRWQKALSALQAELTAEELVVRLRQGELKREDILAGQIEAAERVVRLKNASIAARNRDIHGDLHFYAFRIPRAYLYNLLDAYAQQHNLSKMQRQELEEKLFLGLEVNFNAIKFGQTDSRRNLDWQAKVSALTDSEQEHLSQILVDTLPKEKYQEVVEQTNIPRKQPTKVKSIPASTKVKDLAAELNLDSGKVEVRISEQLRNIINLGVLEEIGGDASTLVTEAKILAYAPPAETSMLDKDILHYLFGGEAKQAQLVVGRNSNETLVFLHEGKELELSEDVIKLVRASFKESVKQFGDYLDRRGRDSIAYPNFSNYVRQDKMKKAVKPISPLMEVWQELFNTIRSKRGVNTANTELQQELKLHKAYNISLNNQVITHTYFSHIEATIEREELDDNIAQKLLEGFAEFTPVIANAELMAAKIKRGGKEGLRAVMEYARELANRGANGQLENLTMIYRGLQNLGDKELVEYFRNKIDEKLQLIEVWKELFDAIRSQRAVDTSDTKLQLELELRGAYQRFLNSPIITHTHFANIETAIAREELDNDTAQELLEGLAEFTPVIANPVMMAAKIARGGEEVLHTAIEYARELAKGGGIQLDNLTMIYRGLQELGDKKLIDYFEDEVDAKMLKRIKSDPQKQNNPHREQIKNMWQELFDAIRSQRAVDTSDTKLQLELELKGAYQASRNSQIITHTNFANIEIAIAREELDDNIAQKLLEGFAEFTPVIANAELMAAKIARGGKEGLRAVMEYARELANRGANGQLENLTMIYRGLQKLGDKELVEYFRKNIDEVMLNKVQTQQQREKIKNMWQELFDAIRSQSEVEALSTALQRELGLTNAYKKSLNNQVITHTYFDNIKKAIEREELDNNTAQELLEGFAEFTPVIANPVMMAAKIARGGEGVLHTAIEYANKLRNGGNNGKLKNLTMIYRGLHELGDKELIEYFEDEVDAKMLKQIKSKM